MWDPKINHLLRQHRDPRYDHKEIITQLDIAIRLFAPEISIVKRSVENGRKGGAIARQPTGQQKGQNEGPPSTSWQSIRQSVNQWQAGEEAVALRAALGSDSHWEESPAPYDDAY